jgi:hypothetical protein
MLRGTSRRTINDKKRKERIKQDAKKLIIHVNNNAQQADNNNTQSQIIAPGHNLNLDNDAIIEGIYFLKPILKIYNNIKNYDLN